MQIGIAFPQCGRVRLDLWMRPSRVNFRQVTTAGGGGTNSRVNSTSRGNLSTAAAVRCAYLLRVVRVVAWRCRGVLQSMGSTGSVAASLIDAIGIIYGITLATYATTNLGTRGRIPPPSPLPDRQARNLTWSRQPTGVFARPSDHQTNVRHPGRNPFVRRHLLVVLK